MGDEVKTQMYFLKQNGSKFLDTFNSLTLIKLLDYFDLW